MRMHESCLALLALFITVPSWAKPPPPSAGPIVTVDNVAPSVEADGATFFLKVKMDVTCKKKVPHGMDVMVRGRCTVGEKMMVDTSGAMDVDIYDLNPGESISVDMNPFINKPLTAVPSQCEISLYLGTMPGDKKQDLGTFCFRNQTVEAKPCK